MERLTHDDCYEELGNEPKFSEAVRKLRAYEDTGLEPEQVEVIAKSYPKLLDVVDELHSYRDIGSLTHLRELAEAEKNGRLVVLPCKITDTIYIVESVFEKKKRVKSNVVSAQIDHITIGGSGKPVLDVETESENWYYALEAGEYYMSREEAEAALEGGPHE